MTHYEVRTMITSEGQVVQLNSEDEEHCKSV